MEYFNIILIIVIIIIIYLIHNSINYNDNNNNNNETFTKIKVNNTNHNNHNRKIHDGCYDISKLNNNNNSNNNEKKEDPIKQYNNDFFNFNNYINQSSKPCYTVNDVINDERIRSETDDKEYQPIKIRDLYDKMTKSRY